MGPEEFDNQYNNQELFTSYTAMWCNNSHLCRTLWSSYN